MNFDFVLIALIIFIASFVQGFSGFGFALISIPLLSLFFPLKTAVPIGALFGLIINILLFWNLKSHIRFKELKFLYFGALAGIPLGVFLLLFISTQTLKYLLSIIIIVFILSTLLKFQRKTYLNEKWGYFVGLLSGILGGAINTNGPPVLIYFQIKSLDKQKFKSSITGFFIVTSIIIVLGHLISGMTTYLVLNNFIYYVPFVFPGFFLGNFLFNKINTNLFNKIILVLLALIAIFLII